LIVDEGKCLWGGVEIREFAGIIFAFLSFIQFYTICARKRGFVHGKIMSILCDRREEVKGCRTKGVGRDGHENCRNLA